METVGTQTAGQGNQGERILGEGVTQEGQPASNCRLEEGCLDGLGSWD